MITAEFTVADDGPALVLTGSVPAPTRVGVAGVRGASSAAVTPSGDSWRAVLALQASRWAGPVLPLPVGEYALTVDDRPAAVTPIPLTMLGAIRAELSGTTVRIGPPIDPAYDSGEGQAALERRYATRPQGLENAAFFESRLGYVVGGDPRAIDRELARRAPNVIRYWSVSDRSVAVPDGAVVVVEGSPQWWRARGAARLLVVDDWLRRRFVRSAGQVVLQTWHGSPPRRLGLRLPGWDLRRAASIVRESLRWNVLLAQSPYSAQALRRGYAFNRPVWVEGGPRNDMLVTAESGDDARAALGIDPQARVLLYAVLDPESVSRVDAAELARRTDSVVVRIGVPLSEVPREEVPIPEEPLSGPLISAPGRVIDATDYPDVERLLLAADALITDRSPLMFDFSVTGKPMFFVVSARAGDQDRPFTVDLESRAPGPLVRTLDELTAALASADDASYAERYRQWRAVFNGRDDGHAAERVVARILDQQFVDR